MNDIYILGISESHTASAALLKNGEIVAAASEERFTRQKLQSGIPKNAIKFCLDFAKIAPKNLTEIAVADLTPPIFGQKSPSLPQPPPPLLNALLDMEEAFERASPRFRQLVFNIYKNFQKLKIPLAQKTRLKNLQRVLPISSEKFTFIPHHTCHASAALFASPFPSLGKSALVLTADGVGDFESATVYSFVDGNLKKLVSIDSQQSLGFFFLHITQLLGLKPIEDEYKVMGLAPYADRQKTREVVKLLLPYFRLQKAKNNWQIAVNEYHLWRQLPKLLRFRRFDAIAAAAQQILEHILIQWVKNLVEATKITNLVTGGGVFANIKVNQRIAAQKCLKKAFFMPSPSDETNALGAAYYLYFQTTGQIPSPLNDLYLGPAASTEAIKKVIGIKRYRIRKFPDINGEVAKLLARGEVVARFAGRMEFGARALGNRSILAHPQKRASVDFINRAIKNRDFWMPFAPTILRERASDYLVPHSADSPFMNVAYDTTAKGKLDLPAAIHPADQTTRPQILDKKVNPKFYDLIKKFEKLTGVGSVLNTSFNLHGEPIVCNPDDALTVFAKSQLKYLVIEDWLIQKR